MENRNVHLFCVRFTLNLLVPLLFCTKAIARPVTPSIVEIMKNDSNLCDKSKFLYESELIKPCASLMYPIDPWNPEKSLDTYLCLGAYDTAYKICQYSSRLQLSFNSTVMLNSHVQKFIPAGDDQHEYEFCESLNGFTSLYNRTNLLWKPLVEGINRVPKCLKICFDLNDRINPLCALLAWIKNIDDNIRKTDRMEMEHNSMAAMHKYVNQPNDKVPSNIVDPNNKTQKKSKIIDEDNTVGTSNLNYNSDINKQKPNNHSPEKEMIPDSEKINFGTGVLDNDKTQQNKENAVDKLDPINNTFLKPKQNTSANNDLQTVNHSVGDVPNKGAVNTDKDKSKNTKQNTDNLRSTTISENTQDEYEGNPEENEESNMGESHDDTIQQPIDTGRPNENLHEPFEPKDSLRYPNIRTEDDSHFFAYFTMITVGCILGYIGYHNKQKILAIVLEGRRSRNNRGRRRPSTSNYRKLDCTLEEAVTSQCNANVTHVIY